MPAHFLKKDLKLNSWLSIVVLASMVMQITKTNYEYRAPLNGHPSNCTLRISTCLFKAVGRAPGCSRSASNNGQLRRGINGDDAHSGSRSGQ